MHFATGKMILCIKKQIKIILSITIQGGNLNIIITKVPPGFAPEHIREAWVNCILPVATEAEKKELNIISRLGSENKDGYEILTSKAIESLRAKGEDTAADFWEEVKNDLGKLLVFKKDCCEEVQEPDMTIGRSFRINLDNKTSS